MAPRANWKGFLTIGELACPVALYTAAATSERIAFHILNRATKNRVHREFVDVETGRPVSRDDQVKGYETAKGEYVTITPDEVAAAVPESDKTLYISAFVDCDEIDDVYLDRPYYVAPADESAAEAFALIREGLRRANVAAVAQAVLFRRARNLLVRPHQAGLIATALHFDYEVRSAKTALRGAPAIKIKKDMLSLAEHIIETKRGRFEPEHFEDRYEAALAELVKAKLAGKTIKAPRREKAGVIDLMSALRQSAGVGAASAKSRAAKGSAHARGHAKAAGPRRKAG